MDKPEADSTAMMREIVRKSRLRDANGYATILGEDICPGKRVGWHGCDVRMLGGVVCWSCKAFLYSTVKCNLYFIDSRRFRCRFCRLDSR